MADTEREGSFSDEAPQASGSASEATSELSEPIPVSPRPRRSLSTTAEDILTSIITSLRQSQSRLKEDVAPSRFRDELPSMQPPSNADLRSARRLKHRSSSAIEHQQDSNPLHGSFPMAHTDRSERPRLTKQSTSRHLSRESSSGSERSIIVTQSLPHGTKLHEMLNSGSGASNMSPKKSLTRRTAFYPSRPDDPNLGKVDSEKTSERVNDEKGSCLGLAQPTAISSDASGTPLGLGSFFGLSANEALNFRKHRSAPIASSSDDTGVEGVESALVASLSRRSQRTSSKRSSAKAKLSKSSVSPSPSSRTLSDSRRSEKLIKSRKKGPHESIMERLAAGVFGEERGGSDADRVMLPHGSLEELFSHILSNETDSLTIQHLILAHRHVVSSALFMRHIMAAFDRACEMDSAETNKSTAQMRILNIMKHWMKLDLNGLKSDAETLACLKVFLQTVDKSSTVGASFANLMKAKVDDLVHVKEAETSDTLAEGAMISEESAAKETGLMLDVMNYLPEEFAKQICLFDHELLSAIPLDEYLRTRWIKNEAPAVSVFSEYSNKFSQHLTVQIASPTSVPVRVAVFSQVVAIGKCLLESFDFTGLLIVFLALQHTLVDKIYKVIGKDLPKNVRHDYEDIVDVMTPLSNFQNYRKFLKVTGGPHVPCLEVHLKDLLYTAEGNEDYIDKEKGVLNLGKLDAMGKIISILYLAPKAETYKYSRKGSVQSELRKLAATPPREISNQIDLLYRRDQRLNANVSKIQVDPPEVTKPKAEPVDPRTAFQSMPVNPAEQILFLTNMYDTLKAFQRALNEREETIGDLEGRKEALDKYAAEIAAAHREVTAAQLMLGLPTLAPLTFASDPMRRTQSEQLPTSAGSLIGTTASSPELIEDVITIVSSTESETAASSTAKVESRSPRVARPKK